MGPIRYGVFRAGRYWKLCCARQPDRLFAHRQRAIESAVRAVRHVRERGLEVELYLQDLNGETRRADPAELGA